MKYSVKHIPFRCLRCDFKANIPQDVSDMPKGTACIKNHCPDCLEKYGQTDDVFLTEAEFEIVLAKENPNQLSLL